MDAGAAVADLVDRVRVRPWGLAVVAIDGDDTEIRLDPGVDPITDGTVFQVGSITKTITGVLVASCVVRGEASLTTTVGEVLGERAGRLAVTTLLARVTQRSGLPRLPPNLVPSDPQDPYADYDEDDLIAALAGVDLDPSTPFLYSNFGFMLLGRLLQEITGRPYATLAVERVFEPMGLQDTGCPPADEARVPGYAGSRPAPWWRTNLPGAGGVGMSITDLGSYLRAHLDRTGDTDLDRVIVPATTMHAEPPDGAGLGWLHQGGGWWHNGGTGGFTSFAAIFPSSRQAVGLLANGGDLGMLDAAGFAVLTAMVRSAAAGHA